MLRNWELPLEKLVAVTTDNGSNMVAAATAANMRRVPCFGHVLHNAINKALEDDRVFRAKG